MKYYTVDSIVRNVLLRRGYPLHWYVQFLVSAKDCLREMALDSMPIINTALIDVETTGNYINLPCDFVDWTKVGIRVGQYVKPLVQRDSINRLHHYDSDGNIDNYEDTTDVPTDADTPIIFGSPVFFWDTVTWDTYGEFTGRLYGFSGAGSNFDTFKYLPERNQIQLNQNLQVDKIVLEYISDGMSCDAATQVDVYAVATIEAYIIWQLKEQGRHYTMGERQLAEREYLKQYDIFRARMNPLTIEDLRRAIYRNYRGSIKT